ncbi:LysM peptidoglycan-binding domain-containing protein [Thalassobacillus pellis]|uniref:LysM peptidoglycan-binding domain-containing protein n=1 Tax=Thalassobacillus pellis TaxID=748008 RepID=UPI00195F9256|nr:LysM domain-containing protein [Thalassobacillus pellis]MBM7552140.1 LysM repeat protein [Thalassobacillus pellis]
MNHHHSRSHGYIIQPGDTYPMLAQRFQVSINDIFAANPGINPYYLWVGQQIRIPGAHSPYSTRQTKKCISPAEMELKSSMRSLWEEHVAWTRMAIISLTFNLPDVDEVITRLLQNATDMGDALKPLYGDEIGDQFGDLVREHLLIAADLVKAALEGNQQAAMEAEKKWYANADQIAAFLSTINPYLTEEEVKKMFYTHLDLTKTEAVLMINKEYEKDIQVYDEIEEQALGMSDAITDAIVKQFPEMFRN